MRVVGGHDGLPETRRVTFCASNTPEQMMGAWINWHRWCLEEHGQEMSAQGFASDWMEKERSGTFLQIIGWDGAEPVAMVELRIINDNLLGKQTCWGDHAFVRADYRKKGIMTDLVQFCIDTATLMGLKHWVVPVTAGAQATAPWLRGVYEAAGFELSGITMARKVA